MSGIGCILSHCPIGMTESNCTERQQSCLEAAIEERHWFGVDSMADAVSVKGDRGEERTGGFFTLFPRQGHFDVHSSSQRGNWS